jgi:hypothetical protein
MKSRFGLCQAIAVSSSVVVSGVVSNPVVIWDIAVYSKAQRDRTVKSI